MATPLARINKDTAAQMAMLCIFIHIELHHILQVQVFVCLFFASFLFCFVFCMHFAQPSNFKSKQWHKILTHNNVGLLFFLYYRRWWIFLLHFSFQSHIISIFQLFQQKYQKNELKHKNQQKVFFLLSFIAYVIFD